MTAAVRHFSANPASASTREVVEKVPFKASSAEWRRAVVFMLTLSAVGLSFPPAYLVLALVLAMAWRADRYDFLMQITIVAGGYALCSGTKNFWVKPEDIALTLGVVSMFLLRMSPMIKRLMWLMVGYAVIVFAIACTSDESLSVQFLRMRNYLAYFYFFVPLLLFANHRFNIDELFRKVLVYALVMCILYILESFVVQGHLLLSGTTGAFDITFTNPRVAFFSMTFPRIYPHGLYLLALCVLPVARVYKLRPWQWAVIAGGLIAARTFSVIAGVVIGYIVAQGNWRRMLKYMGVGVVAFTVLYGIDKAGGGFMRISSTIDQFIYFQTPEEILTEDDIEDNLNTFGSGRIAQIIPKFEALYNMHREWLGMGFLHPEKTKATKYQIDNTYYLDVEKSDEVATGVEVCVLQTVLDIGYIGLIVQFVFFIGMWAVVRRCRYSSYYLSLFIVFSIFGVGGFSGLIFFHGLFLTALALAAAVLDDRDHQWFEERARLEAENSLNHDGND